MTVSPVIHPQEDTSNKVREGVATLEPCSLRTYTPTQAVLQHSSGIYHWTPEGRRLYDFTSGVLVANLGHNQNGWMEHFLRQLRWDALQENPHTPGYVTAVPMTAYNAVTEVEINATSRLVDLLQRCSGGNRLEQVLWAASGSEAIQKALWASLARDRAREMIIATRHGFHGKKGLAGAVTGTETDHDRDPRVRFVSFPREECADVTQREQSFDPLPYRKELEALWHQYGRQLGTFITEPYLGGGGSYHPPKAYLQMAQDFCREHDIVFILDEVQSNFGRTGQLFAFETYGIEPDIVVLGKGLGNGIPVAAAVGRRDIFASLGYGEGSDTWSANPICCAAVVATIEAFEGTDVMENCHASSEIIEQGLIQLKELPFIRHVRGEKTGMVWGVEAAEYQGKSAHDWANRIVLQCYKGENEGNGIHLLGPLAGKVIRIAPPLIISSEEAKSAMALMSRLCRKLQ